MNFFLILSGVVCAWAMLSIISSERSQGVYELKRRVGSGNYQAQSPAATDPKKAASGGDPKPKTAAPAAFPAKH
jgi:hypothetical protein